MTTPTNQIPSLRDSTTSVRVQLKETFDGLAKKKDLIALAVLPPVKESATNSSFVTDPLHGLTPAGASGFKSGKSEHASLLNMVSQLSTLFEAQASSTKAALTSMSRLSKAIQIDTEKMMQYMEAVQYLQGIIDKKADESEVEFFVGKAFNIVSDVLMGAALGGPVGAIAGLIVGGADLAASIPLKNGKVNFEKGQSLYGVAANGLANAIDPNGSPEEKQRWAGAFKIVLSVVIAIIVGLVTGALLAKGVGLAATATEDAAEQASSRAALEGAMDESGTLVESGSAPQSIELDELSTEGKTIAKNAQKADQTVNQAEKAVSKAKTTGDSPGGVSKKGAIRGFLTHPGVRGTLMGTNALRIMLTGDTSKDGKDKELHNGIQDLVLGFGGSEKQANAWNEGITWTLTALDTVGSFASGFAGANDFGGKIFQRTMNLGGVVSGASEGALGTAQATTKTELANLYREMAPAVQAKDAASGAVQIDQTIQQGLDNLMSAAKDQNSNLMSVVSSLLDDFQSVMQPLVQG